MKSYINKKNKTYISTWKNSKCKFSPKLSTVPEIEVFPVGNNLAGAKIKTQRTIRKKINDDLL